MPVTVVSVGFFSFFFLVLTCKRLQDQTSFSLSPLLYSLSLYSVDLPRLLSTSQAVPGRLFIRRLLSRQGRKAWSWAVWMLGFQHPCRPGTSSPFICHLPPWHPNLTQSAAVIQQSLWGDCQVPTPSQTPASCPGPATYFAGPLV